MIAMKTRSRTTPTHAQMMMISTVESSLLESDEMAPTVVLPAAKENDG